MNKSAGFKGTRTGSAVNGSDRAGCNFLIGDHAVVVATILVSAML